MATRQQAAREFVKTWSSDKKGREDADRQTFWNDLLQRVYGINNYYDYITYEKTVEVAPLNGGDASAKSIDGYIPSTKVLIEMKGKKVKDLSKPLLQSDGSLLTPYGQAKRYADALPTNERPNWILVSNFYQIDIYDMNDKVPKPTTILLEDLPTKFKALEFLVDTHQQQIINERKVSVDAGTLVAKIYESLRSAYAQGRNVDVDSPRIQRSLNMLIVRLVFLLYADDTGILGEDDMFQHFIERRKPQDIRPAIRDLFRVLDQDPEKGERNPYLADEFNQFSYVNGGMFSDEDIIIPQFTPELKDLIVNDAGKGFNWSNISPTIFGAVFESTLNPETRRSGGMHYTSVENIHKVIDPLFLDDLRDELTKIQNMGQRNYRIERAKDFQAKLGKLKFLDPACGSGNFLTETYLSLRKMENQCLQIIYENQPILATDNLVKVQIQNFYGIEINDFAVSVARTAMWIAENQMLEETKDTVYYNKDFLPLDSNDSIYEGNALEMNWSQIVKPIELNYIMGNPPFIGARYKDSAQKHDLNVVFQGVKGTNDLDYVAAWYKKAADYIADNTIYCAFVSTNSITQGQQPGILWKLLNDQYHMHINFAFTTFVWNNEAQNKAKVHVVIIGFSRFNNKDKVIYTDGHKVKVSNINGYLIDGADEYITKALRPLTERPAMSLGGQPLDNGNFIFTEDQLDQFTDEEKRLFIRPFMMGKDFIQRKPRYCIWLYKVDPSLYRSNSKIMSRIKKVREFRGQSKRTSTLKAAQYPALFGAIPEEIDSDYIAFPKVSSKRREYIPMDFLSKETIVGDKIFRVNSSSMVVFGILNSSVHNTWMRTVGGRLKSDYSYSNTIVYNNFPWPDLNKSAQQKIANTAQKILDARALYPNSSLADLYDPNSMQPEIRKAHEANDRAVLQAYGLPVKSTDHQIVQHLFKMYEELKKNN